MNCQIRRSVFRSTFIVFVVFTASSLLANQRGPSTPEERARAVHAAQMLQVEPLGLSVQSEKAWLMRWLAEVPDISVPACPAVLGNLNEKNDEYASLLIATEIASEVSFVIEHSEQAKDRDAILLAGVEGALNAYQEVQKEFPTYQLTQFDEMIQKRNHRKLPAYIREAARQCEK